MGKLFVRQIFIATSIFLYTISVFSQAAPDNAAKLEKKDEKKEDKKWYDFITLSAMTRVRPEIKSNVGFKNDRANTYEFIGQKSWITLSASLLENLKTVFTIQDSRIWGGEDGSITGISTSAEKSQSLDLREAFFDLGFLQDSQLHIIGGRQKIVYGDQRLFGALEWNNSGRSFDALRLKWDAGINSLSAWGSLLTESNALDAPQVSAYQGLGDGFFNGLYNTTKISDLFIADVYYANKLNLKDSNTLRHHTVGLRFTDRMANGKTANEFPVDYSLEGAYQFGLKNAKTVSAYAGAATLGYTIDAGIKIRMGAEADIASGDTNPSDKTTQTFDNLFPTNHMHYGQADVISWQNMLAFSGNVNFLFSKEFSAVLSYWYISRLVNTDSWYAVTGGDNKNDSWIKDSRGNVSKSQFLAHEIDLTLKSELNKYFALEGGYSLTLPGTAPTDAGNNKPYHFAYIAGTAKF